MPCMSPLCYTDERQLEVEGEINSISQTLGVALLEHIVVTGRNASLGHGWFKPVGQDENEQRALEEDITGKILWLFLRGICIEVDELLLKVWRYIGQQTILGSLAVISMTIDHPTDLGDEQVHLWRIMLDAAANTSKYQLWLDAQAANQVLPPTLQRNLKQKLAELLDAGASSEDEETICKPKIIKAYTGGII
ncbi:hypothetical protein EDD15DRAFT_1387057 [Pisolithus albus]|nr:hypothetical protein EDD15DRAFT_1387057 [Pisolithus albus]